MKHNLNERRKSALGRLEAQLDSGVKPEKIDGKSTGRMVKLNESDKKRINKQIEVLESRTKIITS